MADGRWQMAEERKDFRQKRGDRGGFGITPSFKVQPFYLSFSAISRRYFHSSYLYHLRQLDTV
jgi:antirestriction protein